MFIVPLLKSYTGEESAGKLAIRGWCYLGPDWLKGKQLGSDWLVRGALDN